jgi:hypothetical protein
VADKIPEELRRIIEFLNKQMNPAEVLGLELRQFAGQGLKTIVPGVVGRLEEASQKRNATRRSEGSWDEASVFADLETRRPSPEVQTARRLVDWMKSSDGTLEFGKGTKDGRISVFFRRNDETFCPVHLFTYGRLEWQFANWKSTPFNSRDKKLEFLRKINSIDGVPKIPEIDISQRPAVSLSAFPPNSAKLDQLIDLLDWAVEQFESSALPT